MRSVSERKQRVQKIIAILRQLFPDAKIVLNYSNPWELVVAVQLSAQCTDVQVNKVTAKLFEKYRTLEDYVNANPHEFEQDIFSCGYYKNKAKHILAAARMVRDRFGGNVPRTMDEMLLLSGVARKTANVVLGNAYGVIEGIAVDTHVMRLSHKLGLTESADPNKIERDLMMIVPRREWLNVTYLLIEYGRKYCPARPHDHANCPLSEFHS